MYLAYAFQVIHNLREHSSYNATCRLSKYCKKSNKFDILIIFPDYLFGVSLYNFQPAHNLEA